MAAFVLAMIVNKYSTGQVGGFFVKLLFSVRLKGKKSAEKNTGTSIGHYPIFLNQHALYMLCNFPQGFSWSRMYS